MPTARVSRPAHDLLRRLAEESGASIQSIIDEAVELYRRQQFLERANQAFGTLHADPDAWSREQAERAAWDSTLADDLGEE